MEVEWGEATDSSSNVAVQFCISIVFIRIQKVYN